MVLTVCKNRGMEVLGLSFWSFSRSVDSGTPNSALSAKYKPVSQSVLSLWLKTFYIIHGSVTEAFVSVRYVKL